MSSVFEGFKKKRDYLLCVDSDGCAMDTMNIKHIKCFGPCMVEEWELADWKEEILKRWNEMNLYTMTRGINRFRGLLLALQEIDKTYRSIDGLAELENWVEHTGELSNESLTKEIGQTDSAILKKTLHWSEMVNERINELDDNEKCPFEGVKDALAFAHCFADIAVVSSANLQAVLDEWKLYKIYQYTDIVLAQDAGSKAFCIQELLKKGYQPDHVMMVGDASGDQKAAEDNGVCFYPILVGHEKESWTDLRENSLDRFVCDAYDGEYQKEKKEAFLNNLQA